MVVLTVTVTISTNGRISVSGILGYICLSLLYSSDYIYTNNYGPPAGPRVVPRAGLGPPLRAGSNEIHCLQRIYKQ